jgi:hypothetical protein
MTPCVAVVVSASVSAGCVLPGVLIRWAGAYRFGSEPCGKLQNEVITV